jgi:hypothetical protein
VASLVWSEGGAAVVVQQSLHITEEDGTEASARHPMFVYKQKNLLSSMLMILLSWSDQKISKLMRSLSARSRINTRYVA